MHTLYEQRHIEVERDGEELRLRQIDHSSNEAAIVLHVSQVRHLAEVAGLLRPLALPAATFDSMDALDGMDHLDVALEENGMVMLYQTRAHDMGGSDDTIALHPLQAAWLVAKLGRLVGVSQGAADRPTDGK